MSTIALEGDNWLSRRNQAMVALMARAGLRVSEVLALRPEDVELNARSGWVLVRKGKGVKERRVPLSAEARQAMRAYLEVRPQRPGPLFLSRTYQPLTGRDVQRVVAVPAGDLGLAGMGMKTARRAMRVVFDRGDFYVGLAARSWGRVVENLDFSRLASPEAEALFYATVHALLSGRESEEPASTPDDAEARGAAGQEAAGPKASPPVHLVLGLPVPLLRDEAVARPLLEALRARLVREHRVQVNGRPFSFTVSAVRAAAQPVGAWADWALDGEGRWAHRAAQGALVAVLDIGFNTLDLYGIRGGRLEPRLVGGDKIGVRRLLDLAAPGEPYHEADERVRAGKVPESALATWLSEVVGTAERVWNGARLDLVLVVGGGAVLLRGHQEAFRRAFRAEVFIPDEPVAANARGLWKWGRTVRW